VEDWDRNKQREERAKISESGYNKWYKRVKGEGNIGIFKKELDRE